MKKSIFLSVSIIFLIYAGIVEAEINEWNYEWLDIDSVSLWNFGWQQNSSEPTWRMQETFASLGTVSAHFGGATESVPVIHILKEVTNFSAFEWTGFHILIDCPGGSGYVPGSAVSDVFGTIVEDGDIIDFYAPQIVGVGKTVTMEFDVIVSEGEFSFNIDQNPIPEPSTLMFLGLGVLMLSRKRLFLFIENIARFKQHLQW